MKSISKILMVVAVLLSTINAFAQIKNAKTETVKIYGNCDMCKATIEKAGNVQKVSSVDWNKDTKMATLTYDSGKINQDEILKRIALAGYDNEKFRAPDDAYAKLPGCCQYDRAIKSAVETKGTEMDMSGHASHNHNEMAPQTNITEQNSSQLTAVFDNYFSVKDALVKTDVATASSKAAALSSSVSAVDMGKLSTEEHTVWMKVMKDLAANAGGIATSKDIAKQREVFAALSKNIYELVKVSKRNIPIYYQYCPMYKANWLSKENAINNPYYGSQMLTCGSTVETLK